MSFLWSKLWGLNCLSLSLNLINLFYFSFKNYTFFFRSKPRCFKTFCLGKSWNWKFFLLMLLFDFRYFFMFFVHLVKIVYQFFLNKINFYLLNWLFLLDELRSDSNYFLIFSFGKLKSFRVSLFLYCKKFQTIA